MDRGAWLLVGLGVLCAAAAGWTVADLITNPRDLWAVGLFVLGSLCGAAWDRARRGG